MNASTTGIIVVDRMAFLAEISARGGIGRSSAIGLADAAVFRKYRGFDGVVWPAPVTGFDLVNGRAPVSCLDAVREYVSATSCPEDCDILLITDCAAEPPHADAEVRFLGFEVGYFESDVSHFSSLLNEVIYGVEVGMTSLYACLNASLLLSSLSQVSELLSARVKLRSLGADLEEGELFQGYAIYSMKDSPYELALARLSG